MGRLHLAGWRFLLEGACPACGHRYLQDLPSGHGLVYPATLDLDTGETIAPAATAWFADWLAPAWRGPDPRPARLEVEVREPRARVTVLNCLDRVYGHAVLKLLNAQRLLESDADRGLVVLLPASLGPLVPTGVSEVWALHEPVGRLAGWLLDLDERLGTELDRFEAAELSPAHPHPHPSSFALERFVGDVPSERLGTPSVVLSLRDDRLWGRSPQAQAANVAALVHALERELPRVGLAAVGPGRPGRLPARVRDLRTPSPGEGDERRWLAAMRGADLAVGVHGSNLLLPSGLAAATIELLPSSRLGNALQATLLSEPDPLLALARHRTIYGDAELGDVSGQRVAELSLSVLRELPRQRSLMGERAAGVAGVGAAGVPSPGPPPPAPRPTVRYRAGAAARALSTRAHSARGRAGEARIAARARRVERFPVVVRDERGLAFELESADEVRAFLRHRGHFESAELALVPRLLAPGATALDVGANMGAFTAAFARRVGPEGSVHAFEPLPAARRRLRRTLELNSLGAVRVEERAVSDGSGAAALASYGAGYESWSTLVPRDIPVPGGTLTAREEVPVRTVTLDLYCEELGIERVDLLKIDVEGAELRVLSGSARLLEAGRIGLVVVEVSDNTLEAAGARALDVLELLEGHGLRPAVVRDGALVPFRVAGPFRELANVVAAGPEARRRLADLYRPAA